MRTLQMIYRVASWSACGVFGGLLEEILKHMKINTHYKPKNEEEWL